MTRRQLLALGFRSRSIEHRLRTGRLHRVMQGVYVVGWPATGRKQRWMAAVLACGDGAVLSHRSAAALWGIGREGPAIDVSVNREKRRPGVHTRVRPGLPPLETTLRDRIPVTSIVQTLIDLALGLSTNELEVLFRPIAAAAGLPVELTKHVVNRFEVDFYWPSLKLVVETDGFRYHRTAATQTRDARRDNAHVAAGLTRLRFTHWQVRHEPRYVRGVLAVTARNLRARAA